MFISGGTSVLNAAASCEEEPEGRPPHPHSAFLGNVVVSDDEDDDDDDATRADDDDDVIFIPCL